MKKRGKVLRDTTAGPGLLMVEGQQHAFELGGQWRSQLPPKPGMVVDVEFGHNGKAQAIYAVAESQIAKEQADAALAAAKGKRTALASSMVARFGIPTLVAAGLLIVSWFYLYTISLQTPLGSLDFTFWQILGLLNSKNAFELLAQNGRGGPSPGPYGLLAVAALAGPFLHHFWKDRLAVLGGLFPLAFILVIALVVRSTVDSALSG